MQKLNQDHIAINGCRGQQAGMDEFDLEAESQGKAIRWHFQSRPKRIRRSRKGLSLRQLQGIA